MQQCTVFATEPSRSCTDLKDRVSLPHSNLVGHRDGCTESQDRIVGTHAGGHLADGHWQHAIPLIVDVFTNQVDTACMRLPELQQ